MKILLFNQDSFVITNDSKQCFYSELKPGRARQISIRDGLEFQEIFDVRRVWRDNRYDPNSKGKQFDIAILELGKNYCYECFNKFCENLYFFREENYF